MRKETLEQVKTVVMNQLTEAGKELELTKKELSLEVQERIETLCGGVVDGFSVKFGPERTDFLFADETGRAKDFSVYYYRTWNDDGRKPAELNYGSTMVKEQHKAWLTLLSVLGVVAKNFTEVATFLKTKAEKYDEREKELKYKELYVQYNDIKKAIENAERDEKASGAIKLLKVGNKLRFFSRSDKEKFMFRINNKEQVTSDTTWEIVKLTDKTITFNLSYEVYGYEADGSKKRITEENCRVKFSDFLACATDDMGVELIAKEAEVK